MANLRETRETEQQAKAPLNCPGLHGLQQTSVPEPGRVCDICDQVLKPGSEAFACKTCEFDVCPTCLDQGLARADVQIERIKKRIDGYTKRQRASYADEAKQAAARAVLPAALLELSDSGTRTDDELIRELLKWFKFDFFRWVNGPSCEQCTASATQHEGMTEPNEEELRYGATRVEAWRCGGCHSLVRFPRYDDPARLLETRRGRCGEWANCFTLIVTALGYRARLVVDWTDHVWTEVWYKGGWHHCDPCESCLDAPLMYEAGWGKKLTYILAFGQQEVVDVTARYTCSWAAVLERRTLISEEQLAQIIEDADSRVRGWLPIPAWREEEESELQRCKMKSTGKSKAGLSAEELSGRKSGSAEWRAQRGELGELGASPVPLYVTEACFLIDPSCKGPSLHSAQLVSGALPGLLAGVKCLELREPLAAVEVEAFSPAAPDPFLSAEGFTVEAWVAASEKELQPLAHANPLISCHGPGSGWELRLCARGGIVFLVTVDGRHHELQSTECCEWRGQWIHVAGTFDGRVSQVFVGKEPMGELQVVAEGSEGCLIPNKLVNRPEKGFQTNQGKTEHKGQGAEFRSPSRPSCHTSHVALLQQCCASGMRVAFEGPLCLGRNPAWKERGARCWLHAMRITLRGCQFNIRVFFGFLCLNRRVV